MTEVLSCVCQAWGLLALTWRICLQTPIFGSTRGLTMAGVSLVLGVVFAAVIAGCVRLVTTFMLLLPSPFPLGLLKDSASDSESSEGGAVLPFVATPGNRDTELALGGLEFSWSLELNCIKGGGHQ